MINVLFLFGGGASVTTALDQASIDAAQEQINVGGWINITDSTGKQFRLNGGAVVGLVIG